MLGTHRIFFEKKTLEIIWRETMEEVDQVVVVLGGKKSGKTEAFVSSIAAMMQKSQYIPQDFLICTPSNSEVWIFWRSFYPII